MAQDMGALHDSGLHIGPKAVIVSRAVPTASASRQELQQSTKRDAAEAHGNL